MNDFDMHLAAASISRDTVVKLAQHGFKRDEFANLTFCHTGDYHGTFRGATPLPSKQLWEDICALLEADEGFSGYLEEESCGEQWRREFNGLSSGSGEHLPPVLMTTCPAGMRKACDIHMALYLDSSPISAVEFMNSLGCASVDRVGPEGVRRVYTITCESLEDGRQLFAELSDHLSRVNGLNGRMKLEVTTRHYRKPADAMTLPIATKDAVAAWFAECRARGLVSSEEYNSIGDRELVLT